MTLLVVTNADDDRHDTGGWHPERPSRSRAALDGIVELGLLLEDVREPCRPATVEEMATVHDVTYLDRLAALAACGGGDLDQETIVSAGSWETATTSAGAGLAAIDALRSGSADAGFVITRPPGHHAQARLGMGFCLINNVAVAAATLANAGERVAIIDWDVHHGNGTQSIFWNDPRVLFVSTHELGSWPGTGAASETGGPDAPGLTLNIPLPSGATGDVMASAFDRLVVPAVAAFAPTWVLVSAGYDAHRDDPLAGLSLTSGDFADLATRVASLGQGDGRTVLFLEGGYDLTAIRRSVAASAASFAEVTYRPEAASAGGPGMDHVDRIVDWWARQDSPPGTTP